MSGLPITIVTCTVGKSADRLNVLLGEMAQFTSLPYRHIISDDGTENKSIVSDQRVVCKKYGAEHLINPGPFGLAENLNFALNHVDTSWALLIEDGVRPSIGWLDWPFLVVRILNDAKFFGRSVGMIGFPVIQAWAVYLAGLIASNHNLSVWYSPHAFRLSDIERDFLGSWNNGRITRQFLANRIGLFSQTGGHRGKSITKKMLEEIGFPLYQYKDRISPSVSWKPGGIVAIKMDVLRELGGLREECAAYEVHFGLKLASSNGLSISTDGPPFFHLPSLGFRSFYCNRQENDGDEYVAIRKDFGVSLGEEDRFAKSFVDERQEQSINGELRRLFNPRINS